MSESSPPSAFEIRLHAQSADIDELGHVNNVIYLRWVQDAAVAHWKALASAEARAKVVWVVVRHEIDYKAPALLGDEIIVRTWVGEATRLTFERHTAAVRAADGKLLAKVRTLWCPIDPTTGRPKRIDAELRAQFSVAKSQGNRSE